MVSRLLTTVRRQLTTATGGSIRRMGSQLFLSGGCRLGVWPLCGQPLSSSSETVGAENRPELRFVGGDARVLESTSSPLLSLRLTDKLTCRVRAHEAEQ